VDFTLSEQHVAIDEGVRKVCADFSDAYWTECEEKARFPEEYYRAMAEGGWLGITMPEELGGAGLGVTEAAIMMQAATSSGGGYSAASAIHLNMFGPHAIVVHGTPEQKERWLGPLIRGEQKACFGVTEPDAGLDTTSIKTFATRVNDGYRVKGRKMWTSTGQVADKILLLTRTTAKKECKRPTDGMTLFYTDLDRTKVEVRRIHKMGRNAVDSNAVFIDDLFVPSKTGSARRARGSSTSWTASTPNASWSPARRSASGATRFGAPRNTPRSGWCLAGPSARTRASSIRWPNAGPISSPRT
jgi:acyl-CoA dehydrogenase